MDQYLPNPYDPFHHVEDPGFFFGREKILEDLSRGLHSREHTPIVLWGSRRIGKSTILFQLKHKLPEFEYVHIDPLTTGFDTMEGLLQEWARQLGTITGENLDYESADEESFRDQLLPETLKALQDQGRDLVCLFDELSLIEEFREAKEPADSRIMRYLYQVHDRHKVRMVFVAPWLLGKLSGELIKGERRISVGNLNREESEELIREPAKGQLAYSEPAIEEVYNFSGGNPHAIQILCFYIWESLIDSDLTLPVAVKPLHVEQVVDRAAEAADGAFVAVWRWIGILSYRALLSWLMWASG